MKISTTAALIFAAVLSVPGSAVAQPYATVATGAAQNNVACTANAQCDNTDLGFKLAGGYRLASWIGAEAIYFDFGAARKTSKASEDHFTTSGAGGGVALRGVLGSWTLTGRAGAARIDAEIQSTNVTANNPITYTTSTPTLQPYGGAEVGYRFSRFVGASVGVDVTQSKWERSDGFSVKWRVAAATAGLTFGK